MKHNEPVSKIMSTELKTVQVGQTLSEARKMLSRADFDHVPVLDGAKLVGMLSTVTLMHLTFDANNVDLRSMDAVLDSQFSIDKVMRKDLLTIKATDSIRHAASLLVKGSHHSISVVEEGDKLVGIVTSTDLIRYLLDQY